MLQVPSLRDVRGSVPPTKAKAARHLLEAGLGVLDAFLVELDLRVKEVRVPGQDRLAALAEELALELRGGVLVEGPPERREAGPVFPAGLGRRSLLEESVDRPVGLPTAPTSRAKLTK